MRLIKAQIQNYRSVRNSEAFEVEPSKTILVGPNEAGKTAILRALQQINPPVDVAKFDPLRDYPRASYNDIKTGKVDPKQTDVATAHFSLEDGDKAALPEEFHNCIYVVGRRLDNTPWHRLEGVPNLSTYKEIKTDLTRLASHMDANLSAPAEGAPSSQKPSEELAEITKAFSDSTSINLDRGNAIDGWLTKHLAKVDEDNNKEVVRLENLQALCQRPKVHDEVLSVLWERLPVFVLFSNYFRVKPSVHLEHLAVRLETGVLDDDQYDYGNECLLRLLGFTARELSNLGKAKEPSASDPVGVQKYKDQLDTRTYQLNAASVRLTEEIRSVWNPNPERAEADTLRISADGQYLKVVVVDGLGVEIELDQRSEGFQWLVSFFVVFFAESAGKHQNAILLLDEPGLSLHGLKQRDFRDTISRLASTNQTIYSTHSPFLVGPDELDLVRVVEMTDRKVGTKVHTKVIANDAGALLPLQEALGYDLAQSLFTQKRNLLLEGLTDLWYVEATADLLRASSMISLDQQIALVPANKASKVVYFATILHANHLKVAALLDSDSAGDQAAKQELLVHTLGNKNILRTLDAYTGTVKQPEIEDLLRDTLVTVGREALGWDVTKTAFAQPDRSIVSIFEAEIHNFSKYALAKAYLRWTRDHEADDLTAAELAQWTNLISKVNNALK